MRKDKYLFKWASPKDLIEHYDPVVNMYKDCFINFHYPDLIIADDYFQEKITDLIEYLKNNEAHVLFVFFNNKLIGFWWVYFSQFINKKRCHINCVYIKKEFRSYGLNSIANKKIYDMAKENKCDEIATMYAVFNKPMAKSLEKSGYTETRVECVKAIE